MGGSFFAPLINRQFIVSHSGLTLKCHLALPDLFSTNPRLVPPQHIKAWKYFFHYLRSRCDDGNMTRCLHQISYHCITVLQGTDACSCLCSHSASAHRGGRHGSAGVAAVLASGEEVRGAALVGADGVRSRVGAHLGLSPPNYAGYSAYRCNEQTNKQISPPPSRPTHTHTVSTAANARMHSTFF